MNEKAKSIRQWPEVYDSCHTFLHIVQVRKHKDMQESHVFHMHATKSDTSGHCLMGIGQ